MNTYEFTHKNTSICIILDADNEAEAWETLAEELKSIDGYRLTDVVKDIEMEEEDE